MTFSYLYAEFGKCGDDDTLYYYCPYCHKRIFEYWEHFDIVKSNMCFCPNCHSECGFQPDIELLSKDDLFNLYWEDANKFYNIIKYGYKGTIKVEEYSDKTQVVFKVLESDSLYAVDSTENGIEPPYPVYEYIIYKRSGLI